MSEWPTRAEALAEAHSDVVNDTERTCVHEWRLIAERPDVGITGSVLTTTVRSWYCVFCRTVEETTA